MGLQNDSPENNVPTERARALRAIRYIVVLVLVPALIPVVCLYLRESGWTKMGMASIAAIFLGYWLGAIFVLARILRNSQRVRTVRLASPLIELQLTQELRERLTRFAEAHKQKLSVATFELLDREIPRFEQEADRDRARHDNEQLRQQAGQGTFLVAVTNEIFRRLLLLSGAQEDNRAVWREQINDTAVRIVTDALDQQKPLMLR